MVTPRAQAPTPERKPAWRAACVAYRERRRPGDLHHEAHRAAMEALQAVWSLEGSERQVKLAVHFASVDHKKWLWKGVGRARPRV